MAVTVTHAGMPSASLRNARLADEPWMYRLSRIRAHSIGMQKG